MGLPRLPVLAVPASLIRRAVLPMTRIHVPFLSATLARAVERQLPDHRVECRVRGVRWTLDLNDLIDQRLYYLGTHERFTTKRILELVPPNGVFFDVGANIGYFSVLVAKKLGGSGRVHAFEPMSAAMNRLQGHLRANGLTNVTTAKVILTDSPRGDMEVAFQTSWPQYENLEQTRTKETVPTTTLDDYIDQHGVTRIDVLKADVDGYELKVFSGGQRMLRNLRPTILIELGRDNLRAAGDSLEALVDLFTRHHYAFYSETTMRRFASPAELMRRVPYDATLNVVCKPE